MNLGEVFAVKIIHWAVFILLTASAVAGCSGGSGSSSSQSQAEDWDTIVWDQDNWQ
jgi:ABC-type glycerol-3-phosphate transport system substrate-binding protein